MAGHVRTMFGGVRGVTVSDVAYSLALVNRLQELREQNGDIYLKAASHVNSQKKAANESKYVQAADTSLVDYDLPMTSIDNTPKDITEISMSEVHVQMENFPEEKNWMVKAIVRGTQPKLLEEDWKNLNNLKHYMRFAVAACGWPIVLYMKPLSATSLCGCCCNAPEVAESAGATCCHSNERAFCLWTGIDEKDLLYASMIADLERLHYYVAIDRIRKKLVVAIRGTMSFQDMATDARQKYVPLHEGSDYVVPEGFLNCAKRIVREVKELKSVRSFLDENKDYGVVFTGHSLGGSASIICTILLTLDKSWSIDVSAYSVGPPPCVSKDMSTQENLKLYSVVFRDDIVPRMCLHSLFRLRSQALASFRRCSDPAMNALSGFRELSDDCDVKRYRTFDFPHVQRTSIDEKNVPPLVIPGRIYHLLGAPKAYPCCPLCCFPCLRWPLAHSSFSPRVPYESVIYPSDPTTFSEIRVSANMLMDHFPHRYENAMNGLRIPERFR
eukprot:CAMPEP_0184501096 /NCGR_PEP_ID=MMETSP0113_2-20130426/46657_1 /TAXON_ID=91329 /ORGANISM="Norrisiella sphaerica, Strain BC52" /LENGTH=498 /DNA_ID=CAMNT_0026889735 /DNA_START=284 /DNA_END=1780 /DNA_ORIENTATION=-